MHGILNQTRHRRVSPSHEIIVERAIERVERRKHANPQDPDKGIDYRELVMRQRTNSSTPNEQRPNNLAR